jgi:hypothetical protein
VRGRASIHPRKAEWLYSLSYLFGVGTKWAFYPFALLRTCPGASLVLAVKLPLCGESYVPRSTASNSPKPHLSSTRLYESAAAYALAPVHGVDRVNTPWEGPRPTNNGSTETILPTLVRGVGELCHSFAHWSRRFYLIYPGTSAPHSYATGLGSH